MHRFQHPSRMFRAFAPFVVLALASVGLVAFAGTGNNAKPQADNGNPQAQHQMMDMGTTHALTDTGQDSADAALAVQAAPNCSQEVALYTAMRKLWGDHMHWTYATVDAFFHEPDELQPKLNRLLANQKDLGAAIVPYYGQAAGDKLAALLTTHINLAVPVLQAAQKGDAAALKTASDAWYANAKEIADFLTSANPTNWPTSVTEPMMQTHITQTTTYSVDLLKADYPTSITDFDTALQHMMGFSDTLSAGIVAQFPDKFAGGASVADCTQQVALNTAMAKLWGDHMHWTYATVDAFFHEPDELQPKLNRLLANQKDLGAAIVPYYGQAAGDNLGALLTTHINLAVPVLTAAQKGDAPGLKTASDAWYANAKEIADFLSSANPTNWPTSVTEPMMQTHITQTTTYSVDLLKADYPTSITDFETALQHMMGFSGTLSTGVIAQFPEKFAAPAAAAPAQASTGSAAPASAAPAPVSAPNTGDGSSVAGGSGGLTDGLLALAATLVVLGAVAGAFGLQRRQRRD